MSLFDEKVEINERITDEEWEKLSSKIAELLEENEELLLEFDEEIYDIVSEEYFKNDMDIVEDNEMFSPCDCEQCLYELEYDLSGGNREKMTQHLIENGVPNEFADDIMDQMYYALLERVRNG